MGTAGRAPPLGADPARRARGRGTGWRPLVPPALVALAQRTGLSRFERDVLLLCAATELDPSIRGLCADVHGNDAMAYPTFALALTVLPDPAWEALAPTARCASSG